MQWDPDLECGVEQVDNEHREIFRMMECLFEGDAKDKDFIESSAKALDFLGVYVENHFRHEEALMEECNYPYTDEHKALHAKFVQTFLKLKKKNEQSGSSPSVAIEIKHAAMSWLVNHINVIDKRFTKYYRESSPAD